MNTCPTVEQLRLWLAGKLDEAQTSEIEAHIEDCAAVCQPLLDRMSGFGGLRTTRSGPRLSGFPIGQAAAGGKNPPTGGLRPDFLTGYRIEGDSPIGCGGMGVVWKATQLPMNRPVALKVMTAAILGSERARMRFEREVELTANLVHPHIARVYDSGIEQGVCYYAMELIDGQNLSDYVEACKLAQGQIIDLMKIVCRAVQYAHQRGIIHRDLKPSNIMVDKEGQPHVLDFGLAKAIESDQHLSIDGEVAGTPVFMSPEQAGGKPDMLDTRSDVYTLGVILFHLLCGQFPHDTSGTSLQVMKRIIENDPKQLREIAPKTDRDLNVLLGKALAKEPDRRYGTAGEFADDLDRYLQHEPINAQPPTISYLLKKKVAKYRGSVAIAAVVCTLLLMTAIWAYARVTYERNRAVAATIETERQHREAVRLKDLAEANAERTLKGEAEAVRQTQVALKQKAIADDQRQLAIQTLTDLIFRVRDKLKQPGLLEVRKSVFDLALAGLKRIDRSADLANVAADRNTAVAKQEMGDLVLALGNVTEARSLYLAALGIGERLAQARPADIKHQEDISVFCGRLGDLFLYNLGDTSTARTYYERDLAICEKIAKAWPANTNARQDVGIVNAHLGAVCDKQGDLTAANVFYRKNVTALEELTAADPSSTPPRVLLSSGYRDLASLSLRQNDTAAAKDYYTKSINVLLAVARADPSIHREYDLTACYQGLGMVSEQLGDNAAARDYFLKSTQTAETLLQLEPSSVVYQNRLAVCYLAVGDVLQKLGDRTAAKGYYEKSLSIRQAIEKADGADTAAQRQTAIALERVGHLSDELGNAAAARDYFEKSLAVHQAQANADPKDLTERINVAKSLAIMGNVSVKLKDTTAAEDYFQRAIKACDGLADSTVPEAQEAVRKVYYSFAAWRQNSGDFAGAKPWFAKLLPLREVFAAKNPSNIQAQRDLIWTYNNLGTLNYHFGEFATCKVNYLGALKVNEALANANPSDLRARHELFQSYSNAGFACINLRQTAEARGYCAKAMELAESFVRAEPASQNTQASLASALMRMGEAESQSGNAAGAREHFQRGLQVWRGMAKWMDAQAPGSNPSSAGRSEASDGIQREISAAYERLGRSSMELNDMAAAARYFEQEHVVDQALLKSDPSNRQDQYGLANSTRNLGVVRLKAGDVSGAQDLLMHSFSLRDGIARVEPSNPKAQSDMLESAYLMGTALEAGKDPRRALEFYGRAEKIALAIDAGGQFKGQHEYTQLYANVRARAKACRDIVATQPANLNQ